MVLKKLGVVVQAGSTGGWRFASQLCVALQSAFPDLSLTVYLGQQVLSDFAADEPFSRLSNAGISAVPFAPPVPHKGRSGLRALAASVRHRKARREEIYQRAELSSNDIVFYAWPYNLDFPSLTCPIAFLPHDFFYMHFAGGFQYSDAVAQSFRDQHAPWMQNGFPVVSTHFIAEELQNAFPSVRRSPEVIHLTNLSSMEPIPSTEAQPLIRSLGIEGDYLLCLNNASYHKNLGQVLAGFHYAQREHPHLQLAICGHGTGGVRGRANSPNYIDRFDKSPNVFGLGLRSDREVTALIQNARVVINASLYEAGNGAGLDAWYLGTPVAMSSIPPFLEQMQVLGVQAETFNPRCCFEIRDAILSILADHHRSHTMVEQSKSALRAYNWEIIARKYKRFFEQIIQESRQAGQAGR